MRRGLRGEVQSDERPHVFRLSGRPQVDIQDQIVAGSRRQAKPSGSTRGRRRASRTGSGVSGSKVSDSNVRSIPAKPSPGSLFQAPAGSCAIDHDVSVMNDARIAGADFDRLHISRLPNLRGKDEVPEDVGTVRRDARETLAASITRSGGPNCQSDYSGTGGASGGRAFGGAVARPLPGSPGSARAEAVFIREIAVACFGQPRRHVSPEGHGGDLRRRAFGRPRRSASGKGPLCPGRWQGAQYFARIGAICW